LADVSIGATLRAARARRKLTQQAVAVKVGVSQPTVNDWESDRCLPRPGRLRKVAQVYGVQLADLIPRAA
jgi:transcriptional regulator with XRE-family HTH domain